MWICDHCRCGGEGGVAVARADEGLAKLTSAGASDYNALSPPSNTSPPPPLTMSLGEYVVEERRLAAAQEPGDDL